MQFWRSTVNCNWQSTNNIRKNQRKPEKTKTDKTSSSIPNDSDKGDRQHIKKAITRDIQQSCIYDSEKDLIGSTEWEIVIIKT